MKLTKIITKKIKSLHQKLVFIIVNFSQKINSTQRIVVAAFVPVFLFIIALPIAEAQAYDDSEIQQSFLEKAFQLDYTWWVWLFVLTIIAYFEFYLFSEK